MKSTEQKQRASVNSGIRALDEVIQSLQIGDNVVWQVDSLEDYLHFAKPFVGQSLQDGRRIVYFRFGTHGAIVEPQKGVEIVEVDPAKGFDVFSAKVQEVIHDRGVGMFYVFDSLSDLVKQWATDELLANFFQATCPYLFELDTVAYFVLMRGQHAHQAVARIRDTTQVLIDVYRADHSLYIHPLKVWERYSPEMFLPHRVAGEEWSPVRHSGEAAELSTRARRPLRAVSHSIAPWESVHRRLMEYQEKEEEWDPASPELVALRHELCRMLIGSHPQFMRLANRYLTLDDLLKVRDRLIGSGRIGGKAAGMIVARRILTEEEGAVDFSSILEPHDSFYIGSDVFFTFLVDNNLFRLRLHLSRTSEMTWEEFEEVEERFLEGRFPPEIVEQFRDMLDHYGAAPIIVRSSSLLEDSFGNAFAGKYRSEFCANQGTPEERLNAFLTAVKLVYASALNPSALSYRRKRGLGENDEQMAILVQRVSGTRFDKYFFPVLAGVAFSRNLYAWNDRIEPQKGVVRLVFGLGTHAVNRVGGDYPRMIAVSHPDLRPEVGARISKYSQREVDLLDLEQNDFRTMDHTDLLGDVKIPGAHLFLSIMKDGYLQDPIGAHVGASSRDTVLTFNNLIRQTIFVKVMGDMLARLERAYGQPIDTEFTARIEDGGVRINLVQCRPMWLPGSSGPVTLPKRIDEEDVLFRSNRLVCGGVVRNIRYIVFIDPRKYAQIAEPEIKRTLGRLVGKLNRHEKIIEGKALMMGPGRWGSSNIDLGVNVGYGDIDNAEVLVEIAREEEGHVPEVSYGTHFFQDLVEAQIIYLPVYPGDPEADFNEEFFEKSRNVLTDFLPESKKFEDAVTVIDVAAESDGELAQVVADAEHQHAVCYVAEAIPEQDTEEMPRQI
jgi:hypothetical protein